MRAAGDETDPAVPVDLARTLGGELEHAARRDPERVLVRCEGRELTVGQLERRSRAVAGALQARGVERGDRVALMMSNGPEFLEAWLGIVRLGAIEVPIHIAYRGPLLTHVLSESGSVLLLCDGDVADRLEGLELPDLRRVLVRGGALPRLARGIATEAWEAALANAPAPLLPVLSGEDPSSILYTSGTTGPSKGAVLTHSANLHLARSAIAFMGYGPSDVLYTAFPLFHVNAKFTSVFASLMTGARLVLEPRFSASRFWDTMRAEGVTAFNSMGSVISILLRQPPRASDREHDVRACYCSACPPALWEPFEHRFGVRVQEHYGMTEIGIALWNRGGRPGACGTPTPWFEVRLADERDRPVAPGEPGELQVRPREPGIMLLDYWKRPDATREAFRNLWFHTGDRVRQDEDGYVWFVDRTKDCIRRRGENISSWELERVLDAFDAIDESAAYGVPSELGEDDVMIAVVARAGLELDVDALLAHCAEHLPSFAVPRYVRVCNQLPKTLTHRVQKFVLREAGITPDTHDRLARPAR
jgi:crotonobetaine/carnitine-CoA ligase